MDGRGSNSWASWKATRPHWLAEKKINILVQIGLKKAPDLPDVPLLMELGTNAEDRALLRLLSASTQIGRPIFTTPEVPAERVAALRAAFDAMMRDPAFLEEAKRGALRHRSGAGRSDAEAGRRDRRDAEGAGRAAAADHRVMRRPSVSGR